MYAKEKRRGVLYMSSLLVPMYSRRWLVYGVFSTCLHKEKLAAPSHTVTLPQQYLPLLQIPTADTHTATEFLSFFFSTIWKGSNCLWLHHGLIAMLWIRIRWIRNYLILLDLLDPNPYCLSKIQLNF